jgi:hypothetical protein
MARAMADRWGRIIRYVFAVCFAFWSAPSVSGNGAPLLAADESAPEIRRVFVPADRPDLWPTGDWQPIPLGELERLLDTAAVERRRPLPFIERAEYQATLVDDELRDARVEWHSRRPDSISSLLKAGEMNLNVSHLAWFEPDSKTIPVPALWGTTPDGATVIVVDRRQGRLVGEWSLSGRKLAASVEFDLKLPPATTSRVTLRMPSGLVLSSTAGEVTSNAQPADPNWTEWSVNLGSRTAVRLRVARRADATAARPLVIVRSNLNYVVRSEAVRLLAEFTVEPLESVLREVHLAVDPEIQITAIENGDGGAVAWRMAETPDGRVAIVQLPESPAAEVQTLRVQGIAQIKPFAAWTLPRIHVQGSLEDAGKVTLRIQPPLQAADIRTEGCVQTELTASAADGETLVFKQLRPDGTITIVPTDGKPDLACRVMNLVTCESNQWSLISQMEWTAAAGSAFAVNCQIPDLWEIVDVRPAPGEDSAPLAGWDVEEVNSEKRLLHVYFLNALEPDRPQRVRISARRLPAAPRELSVMPPLIPSDAGEVEQFVVVTTGPETRPVVESTSEIELLTLRELPEDANRIEFLSARMADRHSRFLTFRTLRSSASARLWVEPFERSSVFRKNSAGVKSSTDFTPDPPDEPRSGSTSPLTPASLEWPVSLDVRLRVSDLSTGFDHYLAKVRLPALDDRLSFHWVLAEPAELIGVSVGGRQVVPLVQNRSYSIDSLPIVAENRQPGDFLVAEIEYRVPAAMHMGPNSRKLVLPVPAGPVLYFGLELVIPERVRLAGQPTGLRLAGFDERYPWQRRLLGPFARPAGEPVFNPFSFASWSSWQGLMRPEISHPDREVVWQAESASVPEQIEFVIWNADEVNWLSIGSLALCALVCLSMRLVQAPLQRKAACLAILCLSLGALTLPPVEAAIFGSALTGLVLAVLLPQRFLEFVHRPAFGPAFGPVDEVPVGSTQSFIPLAGVVLAAGILSLGLAAHAQDDRKPNAPRGSPADKPAVPVHDILIPVDSSGKPDGKSPLAYASADLLAQLRRAAQATALPPYLFGSTAFDGRLNESNQLLVSAKFNVHVLAGDPNVRIHLPLGSVNLGGTSACLVDGQPHPVIAAAPGAGLFLDLPGVPPAAIYPSLPESETESQAVRNLGPSDIEGKSHDEPTPVRTYRIELRMHPPIEAGQNDISSAIVTIPPGCQTQVTISAAIDLPVLGVVQADANVAASQQQPADGKPLIRATSDRPDRVHSPDARHAGDRAVRIQGGAGSQIMFFWSAVSAAKPQPAAQMQAGISCLADVSLSLIQLRYHIAYHLLSGQVDSLVWHVPAGYVLQSVQAPQIAGIRFRTAVDGGRELLLEFSRPQEEEFSLSATFVLPNDRKVNPFPLQLLDPLGSENGGVQNISLRYHQLAVRHSSDLRVNLSSAKSLPGLDRVLKPRPVKEFLKEWAAAGARPQLAFELGQLFTLQVDLENLPAQPSIRGWSEGRFRSGRLDWTYTAEIEQSFAGQFVYRLHVDPRLKIRSVSVQEDGAERLLRKSLVRETLVLLLNDKATRMQTVRIEASLPMSASQEIELPRIRLAGATPGPERITLFRDADLSVRLANPEDFPLPPAVASQPVPTQKGATSSTSPMLADSARETIAGRDLLVARLDFLPEQANPRIHVEPVLPQMTAETAMVVEAEASLWKLTDCVRFKVISGRAETFKIDIPESWAPSVEVRTIPASRTTSDLPVDGRIALVFHPDEPVGDQPFIVVLSGVAEMAGETWPLPAVGLPGAVQTETVLFIPNGGLESVDAKLQTDEVVIPEWVNAIVPALATGPGWKSYRWHGAAPTVEFRATRDSSSKAGIDSARFDLWLAPNGSIEGWLGLKLAESHPPALEFDWPPDANPTSLNISGEFMALPAPESGTWTVALPSAAKNGLVWLSWSDRRQALPRFSEPLTIRVPWPRNLPVEQCFLNLHAPGHFRFDVAPPFVATASRSPADEFPALVSTATERDPGSSAEISVSVSPVPRSGTGFELGPALRVVNEAPGQLLFSIAAALLVSALSWKTASFWHWLTRHETSSWLILSLVWCLWLDPSWLGPLLALCAIFRALFFRNQQTA